LPARWRPATDGLRYRRRLELGLHPCRGELTEVLTDVTDDGLSGSEGQFPCLLVLAGRGARAQRPPGRGAGGFERLLALRNDLGLYAEEYDVTRGQVGKFPQALPTLR
jgi:hypothetical protein